MAAFRDRQVRTTEVRAEVEAKQLVTVTVDLPAECADADEVVIVVRGAVHHGRGTTRTMRLDDFALRRMFDTSQQAESY